MFRTEPFPHQLKAFNLMRGEKAFGLWLDPGLGKSKIVLDVLAEQYKAGEVDCAVIVAPNGVHQAWVEDEIATHLDIDVWLETEIWCYTSEFPKADVPKELRRLAKHDGLLVITITYDAIAQTDRAKNLLYSIVKKRKTAMVLDESTRIKGAGTKTRGRIDTAGKYAVKRYCLTGTPVTNSPFDLYSQLMFLDPEVWGDMRYAAFKERYGVWEKIRGRGGKEFPQLKGYQRTEELYAALHKLGIRMKLEDQIDLPEKVYNRRYFDLTSVQKKLIQDLKDELVAYLDSGERVTAPFVMQQLVRAQQIVSGYVKTDSGEIEFLHHNPRMTVLKELLSDVTCQSIIWAKHRPEVDMICEYLGKNCVRYDGKDANPKRRRASIEAFRAGKVQYFVANPAALSFGLTLNEAKRAIYYSTSWKLEQRIQSEARNHRIGQKHTVICTDIVGRNTIDQRILNSLREGRDVASEITGDRVVGWLKNQSP